MSWGNHFLQPLWGSQPTYMDKVLSYAPIAYWPLAEASGTAAVNYGTLGTDANGAYTGVDLANAIGPDGVNSAPYFDGTNDYVNVLTNAFKGAIAPAIGTIMVWIKRPADPGWNASDADYFVEFRFSSSSYVIRIYKSNATIVFRYQSGATVVTLSATESSTDWLHLALTWTVAGNELKAYRNGSQLGTTKTGLVAPTGDLSLATIGALDLNPNNPWLGHLAHVAVWTSVLTAAQIADLYVTAV